MVTQQTVRRSSTGPAESPTLTREFRAPADTFGEIDADDAATLIAASNDISIAIDADGKVCDLAFGSDGLSDEGFDRWLGKLWVDTVTADSRDKIEALLEAAKEREPARWRQVNHAGKSGQNVPVLYRTVHFAGTGRVLAVGRDLRAVATLQQRLMDVQMSVERDFSRQSQLETRYRLLFQVASEAVLIADATTQVVTEANPAAGTLLDATPQKLVNSPFPDGFDSQGTRAINAMLAGVRASGRTDAVQASLKKTGQVIEVSGSLFRQDTGPLFLVQLSDGQGRGEVSASKKSKVEKIIEHAPDGFVVCDPNGKVLVTNPAFLDLAQLATEQQASGESLARWVGRPGADFGMLLNRLREHGSVRIFPTTLNGDLGTGTEVEISAVFVPHSEPPCMGFTIRNIGPRVLNGGGTQAIRDLPRSADQLTELVGRVKLKELVRESTDMVERLCIEAALELSGDNRSSAAEMLGLSRQSLYVKLRRYGLGSLEPDNDC